MSQSDWELGYQAGFKTGIEMSQPVEKMTRVEMPLFGAQSKPKKRRKLSAWQKFVKTNSKKPRFKYKTGKRKGMVNMKALAAAWKRKKR